MSEERDDARFEAIQTAVLTEDREGVRRLLIDAAHQQAADDERRIADEFER